jgi:hypothetical protein
VPTGTFKRKNAGARREGAPLPTLRSYKAKLRHSGVFVCVFHFDTDSLTRFHPHLPDGRGIVAHVWPPLPVTTAASDVTDTDVIRPDRNTTSMSLARAVALLIGQNAE